MHQLSLARLPEAGGGVGRSRDRQPVQETQAECQRRAEIAKINPLYHTVAGMRALFNATYGDGEIVVGLVVLVALTLVTFTLGARSFARSAA